eukprot:g14998.t1
MGKSGRGSKKNSAKGAAQVKKGSSFKSAGSGGGRGCAAGGATSGKDKSRAGNTRGFDSDQSQASLKRQMQLKRLERIPKPSTYERLELANLLANSGKDVRAGEIYDEVLNAYDGEQLDDKVLLACARYACLLLDTEKADEARAVVDKAFGWIKGRAMPQKKVEDAGGGGADAKGDEKMVKNTNTVQTMQDEDISDFDPWVQVRLNILEAFNDNESSAVTSAATAPKAKTATPAASSSRRGEGTTRTFELLLAETALAWTLVAIEFISFEMLGETEDPGDLIEAARKAVRVNPFVAEVLADMGLDHFSSNILFKDAFIEAIHVAEFGDKSSSSTSQSASSKLRHHVPDAFYSIAHIEACLVYLMGWGQYDVWQDVDGDDGEFAEKFWRNKAMPNLNIFQGPADDKLSDVDASTGAGAEGGIVEEGLTNELEPAEVEDGNRYGDQEPEDESIDILHVPFGFAQGNGSRTDRSVLKKSQENLLSAWDRAREKSQKTIREIEDHMQKNEEEEDGDAEEEDDLVEQFSSLSESQSDDLEEEDL